MDSKRHEGIRCSVSISIVPFLSAYTNGPDYDSFGHKSYKAQNGKECYKSLKLTKKNVFKTKFLCLVMCAVVGKFF